MHATHSDCSHEASVEVASRHNAAAYVVGGCCLLRPCLKPGTKPHSKLYWRPIQPSDSMQLPLKSVPLTSKNVKAIYHHAAFGDALYLPDLGRYT